MTREVKLTYIREHIRHISWSLDGGGREPSPLEPLSQLLMVISCRLCSVDQDRNVSYKPWLPLLFAMLAITKYSFLE